MQTFDTRLKFVLPTGENFLRLMHENILYSMQHGNEAICVLAPLRDRAYTIVNEVGVLPVRNYAATDKLVER